MPPSPIPRRESDVGDMTDDALIAALPRAGMADVLLLAAEAGRRRLIAAVPGLEAVCRRLVGFGVDRPVREQIAALEALSAIGDPEAAKAVARIIARNDVQGPTLAIAVAAAARLVAKIPVGTVLALLRHHDPAVRADACRLGRPHAEIVAVMVDLLDDLNADVSVAAACALGRMGRIEALSPLARLLERAPTAEIIQAIAAVANDAVIVRLGRLARVRPDLAVVVLDALDDCDLPLAAKLADGLRMMPEEGGQTTPPRRPLSDPDSITV